MKLLVNLLLVIFIISNTQAQLGTAHDFTVEDIVDNEHNLYSILDEGKIVIVNVSATWCGPCWSNHVNHILEDVYAVHGPEGSDLMEILWYEGDASTTQADLEGSGGNTLGDWITGVTYPIINENPLQLNSSVYWPLGFPTMNVIRPSDREIVEDTWNWTASEIINLIDDLILSEGLGSTCSLISDGLLGISCDNGATPTDDTDDIISFSLNPTGSELSSGYSLTVSSGSINPTNGNYGSSSNYQLQPGSAGNGNITVTIIDNADPNCTIDVLVMDPGSCSDECLLTDPGINNVICFDNDTNSDHTDDIISFSLNPQGSNHGSEYSVSVSSGSIYPFIGTYGSDSYFELDAGSAGSGDVGITITDLNDPFCTVSVLITDPGICSFACSLNDAGLNDLSCDDNNTSSDPSDDEITFSLNPSGSNLASEYFINILNGTVSPSSGFYGQNTSFTLHSGSAGSGNVIVSVTDADDPTCTIEVFISDPGSCSVACVINVAEFNVFCDDNGTDVDDTDDFISIDLNPLGSNTSVGYSVSVSSGSISPNGGNYGASTFFNLQGGSAGGGNVVLTMTDDNDPSCTFQININDPGTCSNGCVIDNIGLTNLSCNDNGTPSDPSDDFAEFDLNPTGINLASRYTVSVADHMVNPISANYGNPTSFRLVEGSGLYGNTLTIIVTDNDNSICSHEEVVANPGTCSPECEITSPNISGITCMDGGTSSDPSDDVIVFTLNPSSHNNSGTYTVMPGTGSVTPTSGSFGIETIFTLQAGSAGGGLVPITILDANDINCGITANITDPGTCSGTCNIMSSGLLSLECIDNGTDDDPTDDYIGFILNPQGSYQSDSYNVSVSSGTITPTIANYGSNVSYRLQDGAAGSGNVTVTITDGDNPGCSISQVIMDPGSCSNNVCTVHGGIISTEDNLNLCMGDDEERIINLTVSNETGPNGSWIIYAVNALNTILAISDNPQFNIEDLDCYQCMIVFVAYEDGLTGLEVGSPHFALDGCFDQSNTLQITQFFSMGGQVSTVDDTDICLSDGSVNLINMGHTGSGSNYSFVVTDENQNVIQQSVASVDFSTFNEGAYRIYGVAFDANLTLGSTINDLSSDNCLDISDNFIEVNVFTSPNCIVATRDITIDRALSIYPNPTSHNVTIQLKDFNAPSIGRVSIHDINGKLIKQYSEIGQLINLEFPELESGLYLFKIEIDDAQYYRKIIVE